MVKRDFISRIIGAITLILGLIALRVWIFEPVTIGPDMVNQGVSENDVVVAFQQSELSYNQLVAYRVSGQTYVGRLIAQEGDRVTYMDDVLYRNDQVVHETYIQGATDREYTTQDMSVLTLTGQQTDTIPANSYLILNDNRSNTKDSREFGLIARSQVIGPIGFRLTPFERFGFID